MYKVILILDKKFFLKYEGGGKIGRGGDQTDPSKKKQPSKSAALLRLNLKYQH